MVKSGLLPRDAAASQKQGRCGAESVDEVRSHAERHSCITKKGFEGAESIGEAWSLAVRRNSLTEQGRGRAELVDEARSPAD